MTHRPHPVPSNGRRQPWLLAATAVLVLATTACSAPSPEASRSDASPHPEQPATIPPPPVAPPASDPEVLPVPPSSTPVDVEAPDPVRIDIPRVGISAPVVPLRLDPAGALEVPTDFAATGWWTGGSEPGEQGPAVIVGHVDSTRGPAVFYRLRELQPDDVVTVHRADGSQVDFVVDRLDQHPKTAFPTDAVYGPTDRSELRLVTCGGAFDRSTGHYLDNHIVYAHRR